MMPVILKVLKILFFTIVVIFLIILIFFNDPTTSTSRIEKESPEQNTSIKNPLPREKLAEIPEKATESDPQTLEQMLEIENTTKEVAAEPPQEIEPQIPIIESIPPQVNENARSAIVNILCETRKERLIQTITGSGVIIDDRGVILTNAHIAQYFLLTDYPKENATTCTVRNRNPAQDAYKASLLYIPITWIQANADSVALESPSGTGEGDYALLVITESAEEDVELPSSFPFIPIDISEEIVEEEDPVLVISYPAIIAESKSVKDSLYLVSSKTSVGTLFTFGDNLLDLFGVLGNIAAQRGSSGGAVIDKNSSLVGLIVTSTTDALVLNRQLRVLTPAYINRSLTKENGTTFEQLLTGNLLMRSKAFNLTTAPILRKILLGELEK